MPQEKKKLDIQELEKLLQEEDIEAVGKIEFKSAEDILSFNC